MFFLAAVRQRFDSFPLDADGFPFFQQLIALLIVFLFRFRIIDHRVKRHLVTRVEIFSSQLDHTLAQPLARRPNVHVNLLVEHQQPLNVFLTGSLVRRAQLHYTRRLASDIDVEGALCGLRVIGLRCLLVGLNQ